MVEMGRSSPGLEESLWGRAHSGKSRAKNPLEILPVLAGEKREWGLAVKEAVNPAAKSRHFLLENGAPRIPP